MSDAQPIVVDAKGKRHLACSPVALQAVIINADREILLLSSPTRNPDGAWQVVSGALEAGETVLQGVLRETREEAGSEVKVRPLGTIHTHTFAYDARLRYCIAIYTLLAYEGGPIQPGDDMHGSLFRWWSLDDLAAEGVKLYIPRGRRWILERAVSLYGLWKDHQLELDHS